MVHVYSMGIMLGDKESPALVHGAVHGLLEELKDCENGGWYPGITPDNKFLPDKQCYAHAFVLLAASSALLAGEKDAETLLKDALELFDKRFWDEKQGLTYDTWNTEFTVLDDYRGLNANMHTVEAFLAVADAIKEEKYRIRAGRIIDHVIGWQAQMTGEYLNILQRNGKLILIAIKNVLLIVLNLMEQHRAMELSGPD